MTQAMDTEVVYCGLGTGRKFGADMVVTTSGVVAEQLACSTTLCINVVVSVSEVSVYAGQCSLARALFCCSQA